MPETQKSSHQPDAGESANERPVPSQAEGDLETVEEDLENKDAGTDKKG
jgi:hypothetical protein